MKKKLLLVVLLGCLILPAAAIEKFSKDYSKLYNYVLNEDKRPEISQELRDNMINLYFYQRQRNEWANAAKTNNYVCELTEKLYGADDYETLAQRIDRIDNNYYLGLYKQALDESEELYKTTKEKKYTDIANNALLYTANIYMMTEQPLKAIEYYNKIPDKNNFNSWQKADLYINKSKMYLLLAEPEKALATVKQYYKSIKEPNDIDKYRYYQALSEIYSWQGNYNLAMDYIAKAETFVNKVDENNKRLLIGIDFFKGNLYNSTDNSEAAKEILKEVKYYLDKDINNGETENLYRHSMYY